MDADADDVARGDRLGHERFERFVDDHRIAKRSRRRFREDVEPARRDDADAKGHVARVDQVNSHRVRATSGSGRRPGFRGRRPAHESAPRMRCGQSRQLQTSRAAWSVNAESVCVRTPKVNLLAEATQVWCYGVPNRTGGPMKRFFLWPCIL